MHRPETSTAKPVTDRVSLYRLEGLPLSLDGLRQAVTRVVDDDPPDIDVVNVASCSALRVTAYRIRERVRWNATVASITATDPALGSINPGCLILLIVDARAYAITFGHGVNYLDARYIEAGFGIRFAVRVLDPMHVNHIVRNPMTGQGRIEQTLIPGGAAVGSFNVAPWGTLVRRFGGHAGNRSLLPTTGRLGTRALRLSGADALSVRLGTDAQDLIADIREIAKISERDSPVPELEFVTRIRKLGRADTALVVDLDRMLTDQLANFDTDVEIAVPHQILDVYDDIESYAVKIGGRRDVLEAFGIEDIITRTWALQPERRIEALRNGYVACFADRAGREPLGVAQIPAIRWITAEVFHGGDRFVLIDGAWYQIGAEHLAAIRAQVTEILSRPAPVDLPPSRAGETEPAYSKRIARSGLVRLDTKLLTTDLHPNGFEACDMFEIPQRVFVHIKRGVRAENLSHLFTQAVASYDSFTSDAEARRRFADKIRALTGEAIDPGFAPAEIMLAIKWKNGQPVTVDTLPALSQINLLHAAHAMPGVRLTVAAIREK